MIISRVLLLLSLSIVLSGCSSLFGMSEDNTREPTPLTDFQASNTVTRLWSHGAGSGFEENDLVLPIAADKNYLFVSSAKGQLRAFDAAGKTLWSQDTGLNITGGPGAGDGVVVVAGHDGQVMAYAASNGKFLWHADAENEVLAPPAVSNGTAIVKSVDGHVSAFETASGKLMWTYANPSPALVLRGDSAPAVENGIVVIGFADGKVFGFGRQSGQLQWQHVLSLPEGATALQQLVDIDAKPVINDNRVYVVNYQGNIAALSLNDGQALWQHSLSSYTGLAVDETGVYVTDAEGNVLAFDKQSGTILWRQQKLQARGLTAPAMMGNYIVVADAEGMVHWLEKRSGEFAARVDNGSTVIKTAPIVQGNTVYILTVSGELTAYTIRPL